MPGDQPLTTPLRARPARAARTACLLLATAAAGSLSACSPGAVDLAPPSPGSAAVQEAWRAVHDALPTSLHDERARTTSPESTLTAAWGSPAITLACGVAEPAALEATSQLFTIDGVAWFPEQLTSGYRFTTVGRVAHVQVDVPDTYSPEASVLPELAGAIKAADPRR